MQVVWEKLTAFFGEKWTRSHGTHDDSTWATVLTGVTGQQIANGLQECVKQGLKWPPSAPEFRAMCLGEKELSEVEKMQNALYGNAKKNDLLMLEQLTIDKSQRTNSDMQEGREALRKMKSMFA